ncbi:MAG TPA: aldo/keto reductase [Burkholderiaceae bacterium]|nr:aldo/keto reductase [Rhodoferax sp.]HQZ04566.1 aldo/keto reductase [Burkholderiaceae bacterium]
MRYRLLGRTGLYVSELCMGTMTFGGTSGLWKVVGGLAQEASTALVKQAFDAGVNFFDTANVYGLGESETITGQAIRKLGLARDELVIATKAYGVMKDKVVNAGGQSRYHLMHQLDASLQRLQLDHIDLYQLHGYDPLTPLDEVLSALNDMVRSGKVRYIGLCNMAAWQIMKGLGISDKRNLARFESVQAYYTIAGRDLEREVVPMLQDQQLGLMVWSPLAGGLLSGKFNADGTGPDGARRASFDFPLVDKPRAFRCVEAMRAVAQRHGATVAQVALAWLLSRQHVTTVIMGARTTAQLADNLGSMRLTLDPDDLKALDEVSNLPAEYPGWMLTRQGEPRLKAPGQQ